MINDTVQTLLDLLERIEHDDCGLTADELQQAKDALYKDRHLFSAAREMLEALKAAIADASEGQVEGLPVIDLVTVAQCRAAIAQAEGRTH